MRRVLPITGIACALMLGGCVTTAPGPVATQPAHTGVVMAAPAPASPPVAAPQPVVHEELIPERNDIYIAAANDRDIVFVGGNTYIWIAEAGGRRRRLFYGHGDRRQEIFRRRENLRSAMVSPHGGHAVAHYAHDDHRRSEPHHPQQMHAVAMREHGHEPTHHVAANDRGHHRDAHLANRRQDHPFREAAAGNPGVVHRPGQGGQPPGKVVSKS